MNMLEIKNLKKRFSQKVVLDGVSLTLSENKILGFVGKNGAGKTTTMKIILGLLPADEGEAYVMGERVSYGANKTNEYIGYLPDVPEFYSYMTPREYLTLCGEITGMSKAETKKRADELLELVGLSGEKKRIKGFSRGQKQRLGIAQALFNRPKLLICDEPTSALDPVGRKEILDILIKAKEQTTIIFSTHILSDVERVCDEVAFLNDGKIIMQDSVENLKKMGNRSEYHITFENKSDADKICEAFSLTADDKTIKATDYEKCKSIISYAFENNMSIEGFERKEADLEQLFMEVISR